MSENRLKTGKSCKASTLNRELASLFGEQVLARAQACKVQDLDFTPEEIVQAARELRRLSGDWLAQVDMARCLPDDVQAALCMWLADPGMKAKVMAAKGVCLQ
jgi:hypothetical protein